MNRRDFLIGVPGSLLLLKTDISKLQKKQTISMEEIGADLKFVSRSPEEHIEFLRRLGLSEERIARYENTARLNQRFAEAARQKWDQMFLDCCSQ